MAVQTNFLNLPVKFTFPGNKIIDILYDGSGSKLRKTVTDNGVLQYKQDYASGIEYRSTSAVSLSLEGIYHAEGRVFNTNVSTTSADVLRYEYTIKDHLGNTRLTFTDKNNNGVVDVTNTSTNEVLQENHYYPFGLNMSGPWMDDAAVRDNFYQYNGKELNTDFGLGLNDYGARWYDASVGRWWSVDPMAEMYGEWSGYNYGVDNPILFVDPDGMAVTNEYVHDTETDTYVQVGTKGGDETDYIYEGSIRTDADGNATQVAYTTRDAREVKVETALEANENLRPGDRQVSRSPGHNDISYRSFASGGINELGPGEDPIFNGVLLGAGTGFKIFSLLEAAFARRGTALAAKTGGRACFSGAGTEAKAIEQGFQTLGQTRAGQNLQNLITSKNIPWSEAERMWQRLSAIWVKGIPNGSSVPVFLNNPRAGSVWFQTEFPILQSKGVNLIYK